MTNFWNNKNVLLTGHTGFKGGWLALWLKQQGAKVTGFALEPATTPSLFEVAKVANSIDSEIGNICDLESVKSIFLQTQPDIVFHLAAQPLVRYSYQAPVETYATNVMGTLHVLEGIRSVNSVRAAVMITTDKCYENKEWHWGYRENEPMGGFDPYSSSKGCSELLISSYRNSFFPTHLYSEHRTAIASARAGNVIGGGDWSEDRLIPDIIKALQRNQTIYIRNPHAIRPWQHVLEPLSGYLMLAEKLYCEGAPYAEAWNFGPYHQDTKPVEWIARRMSELWGSDTPWQIDNDSHPHEAHYLKLDCSKANSLLNWKPAWSLTTALQAIVDWHKAEITGNNMQEFCLAQIAAYQQSATTLGNEHYEHKNTN
ncbi:MULTISPECIES: CDP-glucose 4,6-dehydratase [Methylomonas]|uniref:CDP-glucose 4,6-dehydratase n=1 Tax=Methylomonas TaxID=416 RepID=UPI001231861E|nr:CDP-glucose 4,6-dehydratase [Methylomonas rhizoryzae]